MEDGRKTPFYEEHCRLNAKIINFNGWLMPVEYTGIIPETEATREKAGLFDVSHMGNIMVSGGDARHFLQGILTNDLDKLAPGQASCALICQHDGGTIDDLLVYCLDEESFLLVVNAVNTEVDFNWLHQQLEKDKKEGEGNEVSVEDVTLDYAAVALQGPSSQDILEELTASSFSHLRSFRFLSGVELAGVNCLVSRTGYTGEDGFEVFCSPEEATVLWKAIWEAGQKENRGLTAAGLGARGLLRLEASMPLYNQEISREITPLEAGLHRFVALNKETPFVGQEALHKQQKEGLKRKLAGLEMLKRGVPREGYPVMLGEEEIGWVSSGSYSPNLKKPIAMAFLPPEKAVPGTEVDIVIRGKKYPCQVVQIPFYRRERR